MGISETPLECTCFAKLESVARNEPPRPVQTFEPCPVHGHDLSVAKEVLRERLRGMEQERTLAGVLERTRPPEFSKPCKRPPSGWWCSRGFGHDGPCAARKYSSSVVHFKTSTNTYACSDHIPAPTAPARTTSLSAVTCGACIASEAYGACAKAEERGLREAPEPTPEALPPDASTTQRAALAAKLYPPEQLRTAPAPKVRDARPSWDRYFMDIAEAVSVRGTCDRKKVGAVLVAENRILATGYNGALPGMPSCDEAGHDFAETLDTLGVPRSNCVRTVHAEANALASAARFGVALGEPTASTCYVNTYPCWPCFRLLVAAGVRRIVFRDAYRPDERVEEAARQSGVALSQLEGWEP